MSVSPNGKTAYVEVGGLIQAVDIATGALGVAYGTSGAPDGSGVISGSLFNGLIIGNTNFGNIDLIDSTTGLFTTTATGGTRGDYVRTPLVRMYRGFVRRYYSEESPHPEGGPRRLCVIHTKFEAGLSTTA